ncbi:MAG TPA: hypothetical protein VNY27_07040 [Solirubrobacteraceae bacterium]|jgi:hypothetical protein|nr:hypothetical protein [Solirubrobacteraceae bacterium]
MDIDTIIEELDKLVHYRGDGGLVAATADAPKLLRQPRYQQAEGDSHELLAKDIKTAIARLPNDPNKRLPKGLQSEANGLLRISMPEQHIISRLGLLGKGGYSTDAQQWHRKAVLGRVATELMKFYADLPGYRILDTKIHVSEGIFGGSLIGPGVQHARDIDFIWTIESLVSDLRWFVFSHHTQRRLKFTDFRPGSEGYDCESADRLPIGTRRDEHWYILRLSDNPPVGVPIQLHAHITYDKASKAEPQLNYLLSMPTRSLSLAVATSGEDGNHTCVELDDKAGKVLRRFKAKTAIKTTEYGEEGFTEYTSVEKLGRFTIRSPQLGRCYRLEWPRKLF